MLFWIALPLALVAAVLMAVVVLRRWKEIRMLDPETIRREQERKARDRIVRERFERLLKRWSTPIRRTGKRVSVGLQRMEARLRRASGMRVSSDDAEPDRTQGPGRLQRMLHEAAVFAREGKVNRAERAYLEALKIDMRSAEAYRGLGELYLNDRQYKQARETFQFLISMKAADDGVYAGLAHIDETEGQIPEAEEKRKKALSLNSKSPKRHAELAAFYIKQSRGEEAWQYARKASEIDPKSPRYLELSVEAAILVRDRKEAEMRYERLRLMGYDRAKLQRLKERLDAMG